MRIPLGYVLKRIGFLICRHVDGGDDQFHLTALKPQRSRCRAGDPENRHDG